MKLFSLPENLYRCTKRVYESYRVQRCVELGRELMAKGEFEKALSSLMEAQRFDVSLSPRDALLLSFCLFRLNKDTAAYKVAVAVEDSIRCDSRHYNEDEVEYLIAYSRFIRNTCASRQTNPVLSPSPIDMSGIDLRRVSDDLLATFPLVKHPDWDKLGWPD